jgi:cold shock CspA family protein
MDTLNKYTGRVKWFNTKAGYGFITMNMNKEEASEVSEVSDVFVHHSSLCISREQYRYLVQGEYVEFTLSNMENSSHKHQATNVKGLNGGNLMCETRYDSQLLRNRDNHSREYSSEHMRSRARTHHRVHDNHSPELQDREYSSDHVHQGDRVRHHRVRAPRRMHDNKES